MWPWYLSLVEDLRDASMMFVASSDNLLFSVRNLLSHRRAIFLQRGCSVCGCCGRWSRCLLEVSRTGASVSILNIWGNRSWFRKNGTTKIPPAAYLLGLNFFQDFWNEWKWWESIDSQGASVSCQLINTRGFRAWLVRIVSMKLMVYITCK